jgi:hypothetical protein
MIRTTLVSRLRRGSLAIARVLALVLGMTVVNAEQRQPEHSSTIDAALLRHGIGPGHLRPDVIVSWNMLAHDLAFAEDRFLTFKGQRALAMMHLAMHDALNAIVPIYQSYAYSGGTRLGHPTAAAAQAAHDVLIALYPDQHAKLTDQLGRWLAQVPDGPLRQRGTALGKATATAVLARRDNDGWDFPGTYQFRQGPGRYQTTPPWDGFVAQPGFRFAKPFGLEYSHQFRPPPPPPLRSTAYARAFREVKEYGAADSLRRTDDQTAYAVWWMEFAEGSVNRLARQLAVDRNLHLWKTARLLAHVGVALYDAYVATWDSKYVYDHWRPYTAIRDADADENPRTSSDADWAPLRPTPPFPEYVSAHAAACGASFDVLQQVFGHRVSFTMETTTAPPGMPTRTFTSFDAAAAECADSRVRLGWHFPYATDAGLALGKQVARYALSHSLGTLRE